MTLLTMSDYQHVAIFHLRCRACGDESESLEREDPCRVCGSPTEVYGIAERLLKLPQTA